MKCFERIILHYSKPQTEPHCHPNQFAYKLNRSIDDATLACIMDTPIWNKTVSFVRILLVDFSSGLNTIQPQLMALKLLRLHVNPNLVLWIVSFLVNRTQSVRFKGRSRLLDPLLPRGSPQGKVLSPILFTLYTNTLVLL